MPLTKDNWTDYWANTDPKCPHCDYDININNNELWELYEEGKHNIDCPSCGKAMIVYVNVERSFSTDEQEDE